MIAIVAIAAPAVAGECHQNYIAGHHTNTRAAAWSIEALASNSALLESQCFFM
jgi:hypothetical protein